MTCTSTDCQACAGFGLDDAGGRCSACAGSGISTAERMRQRAEKFRSLQRVVGELSDADLDSVTSTIEDALAEIRKRRGEKP